MNHTRLPMLNILMNFYNLHFWNCKSRLESLTSWDQDRIQTTYTVHMCPIIMMTHTCTTIPGPMASSQQMRACCHSNALTSGLGFTLHEKSRLTICICLCSVHSVLHDACARFTGSWLRSSKTEGWFSPCFIHVPQCSSSFYTDLTEIYYQVHPFQHQPYIDVYQWKILLELHGKMLHKIHTKLIQRFFQQLA